MDAEQLLYEGETVVFSVDQLPFEARGNHFTILYPLLTIRGEQLSASAEAFPNRGRVWWYIREEHLPLVTPGSLWTARIEEAHGWHRDDGESDRFQVKWDSMRHDGQGLLEILDVPEEDPDIKLIREERFFPWPRRPLGRVFLRGAKSVIGPFHTEWQTDANELRLGVRAGGVRALRIPRGEFDQIVPCTTVTHRTNEYEKYQTGESHKINIVLESDVDLAALRTHADQLDLRTDREIVKTAARQAKCPRNIRTDINRVFDELDRAQLGDDLSVRLREVKGAALAASARAEDVAKVLAETPIYHEIVQQHIQAVTAKRIEEEVEKQRARIQRELTSLETTKANIRRDIADLRKTYEAEVRKQEEQLQKANEGWIRNLEDTEAELEKREQAVIKKESQFRERLERITTQYHEQAERIGDEILMQLPIIERLLQDRLPGSGRSRAEDAKRATPAFLAHPRKKAEVELKESAFIEQLKDVTSQRGFVFDISDLINFHVCVKTAGLTVLAGTSGTGKSTLPRLYAEALGCKDEYLHVPVRPDWLDDRDVLGAYNPIAGRFEPGASGLVDHLIAANLDRRESRGGIYVICLDEMNLARVEHYFAQFLSVMDNPPAQQLLTLFSGGICAPDDPYAEFQRLLLGPNVSFVGTVNMDESANFFSPKVLDRVQMVTLGTPKLENMTQGSAAGSLPGIAPVAFETFATWIEVPPKDCAARDFLLELDALLRPHRIGISGRRFNQILSYVASATAFMDTDCALDFQVRQKVLPWLTPGLNQFAQVRDDLQKLIVPERFPRSCEVLERLGDAEPEDELFQLF